MRSAVFVELGMLGRGDSFGGLVRGGSVGGAREDAGGFDFDVGGDELGDSGDGFWVGSTVGDMSSSSQPFENPNQPLVFTLFEAGRERKIHQREVREKYQEADTENERMIRRRLLDFFERRMKVWKEKKRKKTNTVIDIKAMSSSLSFHFQLFFGCSGMPFWKGNTRACLSRVRISYNSVSNLLMVE